MKIKNISSSNYLLLLFAAPLVINFLINLYRGEINFEPSLVAFYIFLSTTLYSLFYFQFGVLIKKLLNLKNISYGITIYFLSFFIIDNTLLFVTKNISFQRLHFIVCIFWIILLIAKMGLSKNILILLGFKISLITFHIIFLLKIPINYSFVGDVKSMWLPWLNTLYANNSYFLMKTNTREGAGLLITHIQSTIFNDGFPFQNYNFIPSTTYILFLLGMLFIYELKLPRNITFFICTIYSILIINSDWLNYLFVSSLMGESILSILFAILLINFMNIHKENHNRFNKILSILLFSHMYHTKFFVNIIVYLIIFVVCIYRREIFSILLSLFTISINELNYRFLLEDISRNELIKEANLASVFEMGIKGFKFINIENIFKHIAIDKPMVYLITLGLVIHIINFSLKQLSYSSSFSLSLLFINLMFVIFLYIAIWKDVEYESAYRYILNLFHIILFWIGVNLKDLLGKNLSLTKLK